MPKRIAAILSIILAFAVATACVPFMDGLSLHGGSVIVFEAGVDNPTAEQMNSAHDILRVRLDTMGYFHATILIQPPNRIRVEIPAVEISREDAQTLGEVGLLTFVGGDGELIMTGEYVERASVRYDFIGPVEMGRQIHIEFTLTRDGQSVFAEATERLSAPLGHEVRNFAAMFTEMTTERTDIFSEPVELRNAEFPIRSNSIAIILDDYVVSAPTVAQRLNERMLIITGQFTREEAQALAGVINSGRLNIPLIPIEIYNVGSIFGDNHENY